MALQAELAIPEGPLLLTIVVAQLALLRLYCMREGERGDGPGIGIGARVLDRAGLCGILLNAFAAPILSLASADRALLL